MSKRQLLLSLTSCSQPTRPVDIPARLLLLLGLGEARALHVSVSKAAALFTPWSLSFYICSGSSRHLRWLS